MPKGRQWKTDLHSLSQWEAREAQDVGETSSIVVHEFMEPMQLFKHQVSEACLL